jgi:hypothetical protein
MFSFPLFFPQPYPLAMLWKHSILFCVYSSVAATVSPECVSAWDSLSVDENFVYQNTTAARLCYVKYQNAVAVAGAPTSVNCEFSEFTDSCQSVAGGSICTLRNSDWLEFNICLPPQCGSSDLEGLVSTYFNSTASIIDCSRTTPSPIVASIVATVSVAVVTVLLVLSLRPPRAIRQEAQLAKAKGVLRDVKR